MDCWLVEMHGFPNKKEFSLSSLHPSFIFSRNCTVPYYWCHFYGELDREMLNVEGSRTDTTCRTCTSCQLKLGLFSRKMSV